MSQYIKEFGICSSLGQGIIKNIINYVVSDKGLMQASKLYSPIRDERFVDVTKRSSTYKTITQDQLFDMFDQLLNEINRIDKTYNFFLVRNDITYIKYSEGDFFEQHEDYLSITSNFIEEYTMIICADANCVGGRTIFEVNPFLTHRSEASIMPEHCLVFRKDLKHAGEKIEKGFKNIITANLLCVAKKTDQLFLVKFPDQNKQSELKLKPNPESELPKSSETGLFTEPGQENPFNTETKYFVLSVNRLKEFKENFFTAWMYFNNQSDNQLIQYEEQIIDYDSFYVINKILNKCYITAQEYHKVKQVIDYYMIPIGDVLIDYRTMTPNDAMLPIDKNQNQNIQFITDDIMIINNAENFQFVCKILSGTNTHYLPYKIIFVEGTVYMNEYHVDDSSSTIKLLPVWFSVSENDNIMFFENVMSHSEDSEGSSKDWKWIRENRSYKTLCDQKNNLGQRIQTDKPIQLISSWGYVSGEDYDDDDEYSNDEVSLIYDADTCCDWS